MGPVATVLIQNGTLHCGDALVIGSMWGRVKTMHDEFRREFLEAGPSTPVEITGLSAFRKPVKILSSSKTRKKRAKLQKSCTRNKANKHCSKARKTTMDSLLLQATEGTKKVLNLILRADVQGSLEALKAALMKIQSKKAEVNIIFAGVGEVSESDVQRAVSAKATIIGFHSQIESHAEALLKPLEYKFACTKSSTMPLMTQGYPHKPPRQDRMETEKGKAEVRAIFKSSHQG